MGYSKVWLAMTPQERAVKRQEYRARYNQRHPDAEKIANRKYKTVHHDAYAESSARREREKRARHKIAAIEYMGGHCVRCGGVFHPDIYDFHHLDPNEKDVPLSRLMGQSWPRIQKELDKCVMLCANCHRFEHIKY